MNDEFLDWMEKKGFINKYSKDYEHKAAFDVDNMREAFNASRKVLLTDEEKKQLADMLNPSEMKPSMPANFTQTRLAYKLRSLGVQI